MTRHEIAAMACKILGIYAIIHALGMPLTSFIWPLDEFFRNPDHHLMTNVYRLLATVTPFGLLIGSGVLLWRLADRLAISITSRMGTGSTEHRVCSADIHVIAFSVVGLFVLAQAIPNLAQVFMGLWIRAQAPPYAQGNMSTHAIVQSVGLVIKLAMGFWLFFGSRGLVELLSKMRKGSLAEMEKRSPLDDQPDKP
ncbi:MAG: hypothetical protein ABIH23_20335 [bacterium]